jgi:hypothetical protein
MPGGVAAVLAVALAAGGLRPAQAANLAQNPGFEADFTGPSPPSTVSPPTDWTVSPLGQAGADTSQPHTGIGDAFISSGLGLQQVPIPSTLSQEIATTPGTTYTVSFWLVPGAGSGQDALFQAAFAGTESTAITLSDFTVGNFTYEEFSFNALSDPSGTSLLAFTGSNISDNWYLDDVSVIANVLPTLIPEPASMLLLLAGASGIAWVRRRS